MSALDQQAVFVHGKGGAAPGRPWEFAHVLVGPVSTLSARYALRLPDLPAELLRLSRNGRLPQITGACLNIRPARSGIERRARSASAIELLEPLLSCILAGEQSVTMPWTEPLLPEAVLWGLVSIPSMLGGSRPISFLTLAAGPTEEVAGLIVSFRRGVAAPHPDPGMTRRPLDWRPATPTTRPNCTRRSSSTGSSGQPTRRAVAHACSTRDPRLGRPPGTTRPVALRHRARLERIRPGTLTRGAPTP